MTRLLQFNNVSIEINNSDTLFTPVKQVSFEIHKGRCTALIGESGSGKTLTSLSILKLLPANVNLKGDILFWDGDQSFSIPQLSSKELKAIRGNKISMIFQEPSMALNPLLTCGYQICEVIRNHLRVSKKEAKQKTIALIQEVELSDPEKVYKQYPHELSGGQKQRVVIAMAIACKPSLLIADEPTTALDVMTQKNIMDLLMKLKVQYQMSILLVTHDIGLASAYSDEILVFYKGDLIEYGKTSEILRYPKHPYTIALLNCRPKITDKGKKLSVLSDFISPTSSIDIVDKTNWNTSPAFINEGPFLTIENLSVKFPIKKNFWGTPTTYHTAVDNVSFDIYKNEIVGIVGESGCGKTTLGRTILQLIQPYDGKILLNGQHLSSSNGSKSMQTGLQIVFQDPYASLNPKITVGTAIEEPINTHHLASNKIHAKKKAIALLERVGLNEKMYHHYPHEFSGGQRQRISIARALAVEPSFMVFDESIAALDLSIQSQILNLISDLKKNYGLTALFISHDIISTCYISDRILILKNGRIVESGIATEVFNHPSTDYTRSLIEAIPGKSLI